MERLEVTPSALRACADRLSRAVNGITEELELLATAADDLRLAWDGDAQNAFDDAQTRLRRALMQRSQSLSHIAKEVVDLANAYGDTDRAAAKALGGQ